MNRPDTLILHANGSNRDHDAALAFELAGAHAEIIHINQLRTKEKHWRDYQLLALPGGFSYADALGAGKLMALDSPGGVAGALARLVALTGDIEAVEQLYAALDRVTPEAVQRAARKYFDARRRTVVVLRGTEG